MHPVLWTNTHNDITDLVNHGMVKNTKTSISWKWNIIFLQNKKNLNLCLRWHILRSYHFLAEVTFKAVTEFVLHHLIPYMSLQVWIYERTFYTAPGVNNWDCKSIWNDVFGDWATWFQSFKPSYRIQGNFPEVWNDGQFQQCFDSCTKYNTTSNNVLQFWT